MKHLTVILGGDRSGKSRYAINRGTVLGRRKHLLATVQALDEKTVHRIQASRLDRSDEWTTTEEAIKVPDVVGYLHTRTDVLVIDCIAHWLANLLIVDPQREIEKDADALITQIKRVDYSVVAVSTESGCGLVPRDPVSQHFWDTVGPLNQLLAGLSNEVYFMVAGQPLRVS